eukprot:s3008_g3.t1
MARRIEAQVSRDWVFGFTSWNLLFRSALNLSRTTNAYSRSFYDEETQEWVKPTGKHVEEAAQQLLKTLKGSYVDVTGQPRPVKGDVSKLRYVPGLKPMARKLLTNMRHTAQGLPGTQEARKRMRFEIQAMRIRYGVPLFVTYTPDEAHQLLYVRMTRVECCNLRAHHRESAVVSAERIATTTFESFPGAAFAEFVAMYHNEAANAPATKRSTSRWTRRQASGVRHLGTIDIVQVYGHRRGIRSVVVVTV